MTKKRNEAPLMTAKEFIEKVQSLLSDDGASQGVSLKESVELALKNPLPNFWNIIEYGEGNPGKYGRSAHERDIRVCCDGSLIRRKTIIAGTISRENCLR
jgi:hypothetical protein